MLLSLFLLSPLLLLLGAKLFRIPRISFRNTFITYLLLFGLGMALGILTSLTNEVITDSILVQLLMALAAFLGMIWIIRHRFDTTMLRAAGIYLFLIVGLIVIAGSVRCFMIQAFRIPSGGMKPTLLVGDHILANKFIYGVKAPFSGAILIPVTEPKRGDIVIFPFPEDPKKDFIKRVIGIPGDVVEIRNKRVFLNHQPMVDTYGVYIDPHVIPGGAIPRDSFGPVTVPTGALFVMGDNRDHSYDSRFWGFVKKASVKGKATSIYWSWDRDSSMVRWHRIGSKVR